jgi:hypothetical protein
MASWNELLNLEGRSGCVRDDPRSLSDVNTLEAEEVDFESGAKHVLLWWPPSWEEINAAEAKEKMESKQP